MLICARYRKLVSLAFSLVSNATGHVLAAELPVTTEHQNLTRY